MRSRSPSRSATTTTSCAKSRRRPTSGSSPPPAAARAASPPAPGASPSPTRPARRRRRSPGRRTGRRSPSRAARPRTRARRHPDAWRSSPSPPARRAASRRWSWTRRSRSSRRTGRASPTGRRAARSAGARTRTRSRPPPAAPRAAARPPPPPAPRDGRTRRLDLGETEPTHGYWPDASLSKSGAMVYTATTPSHPRELYYLSSFDAKPRQLTHLNDWISERQLSRSEAISWNNEGFALNGIVTYPPDFDATKNYPLVLYIHGGPRAASTMAFATIPQSLAAQGWVVFQPNYRGSDNAGDAFTRAILDDSGAGPGRDVMAGINELKKRGFVDESRIGVGGWSYGGSQ